MAEQTTGSGTSEKRYGETLRSFSARTLDARRKFAEKPDRADVGSKRVAQTDNRNTGPHYVSRMAESIRRASWEFDSDFPLAGNCMRHAASHIQTVADTMRTADLNDLIRNVRSFARRQPIAFVGIGALAVFAAARLLKSSSGLHGADRR